jgi:hypothetical protein
MTEKRKRIKRGRRAIYVYPKATNVTLEGNIALAIDKAIAQRINGAHYVNDVVLESLMLYFQKHGIEIPSIEEGSIFAKT